MYSSKIYSSIISNFILPEDAHRYRFASAPAALSERTNIYLLWRAGT